MLIPMYLHIPSPHQSRPVFTIRMSLVFGMFLLMLTSAFAQTTWNTTNGSWNVSGNWTPTGVPVSNIDNFFIFNRNTGSYTATDNINTDGSTFNVNKLQFGGSATSLTTTLAATGSAALTLVNNSSTAGPTIEDAGSANATVSIPLVLGNNLTLTGSGSGLVTLSGLISETGGSRGVTLNTSGIFALSGANTYTGGTTLTAGTLRIGATGTMSAGPVGTGTLTLNGGAISSTNTGGRTLTNSLAVGSNSSVAYGNATNNGTLTFSGATTFGSAASMSFASGVIFSGTKTLTGNVTVLPASTATVTFSGSAIGDGGSNYGITIGNGTSTGTVQFNNVNNTFGGGVTLNSGSITIGGSSSVFGTGGTLTLNGNGSKISSTDTGIRSIANALSVGSSADITFGNATNTGALTFSGSATLGNNSTVRAASNVSFSNASITMGSNVILAPSSSVTMTFNNLDASNGVTLNYALGSSAPLTITNLFSDNSDTLFNFNFTSGLTDVTYTLIHFGSVPVDMDTSIFHILSGSLEGTPIWSIDRINHNVNLTFAVPEPSTFALFGLGMIVAIFGIRRAGKSRNNSR